MAGLKGFFNFFFPVFPSTSWQVNEWNDGFCSGQPKALPFLSMHPEDTSRERRDLMREFLINRHFVGVKVHSYIQRIRLDSDWLREVCAVLTEQKRLLYVHTGFSDLFRSRYGEEEMAHHLARILEEFPNLPVIAAHMLYPRLDIASQLLKSYPSLHLDLAGLHSWVCQDGKFEEWIGCCERYADRILFGSDSAFTKETLAETIQTFEALPLSEKTLNRIGGENALLLVHSLDLPASNVGILRSEATES